MKHNHYAHSPKQNWSIFLYPYEIINLFQPMIKKKKKSRPKQSNNKKNEKKVQEMIEERR